MSSALEQAVAIASASGLFNGVVYLLFLVHSNKKISVQHRLHSTKKMDSSSIVSCISNLERPRRRQSGENGIRKNKMRNKREVSEVFYCC